MKKAKKLLACIMVALLLVSSLPMAVVSADTLVTDDGFEYEIENNSAIITGYTGTETTIVIPENIDGVAVKEIGSKAFENSLAENVTLPESLTKIGSRAFAGCTNLTAIAFPDSVTLIDNDAFANCKTLKDVTLSKGLTELGYRAFMNTAIESIEIPKSLDKADSFIGNSYTFNDKEYSVPDGPFFLCENLKTVTFQKGTTQIAEHLFAGAIGIEEITIPDTVTAIEYGAFKSCLRLGSIVIPDSVTIIDNDAFANCATLKDVTLSKGLTELGYRAFENTAIESIEIPRSLDKADTFTGNNYTFNDKEYYVPDGPFSLCENLKTVTFEKGTTQIAEYLFAGAIGIEEITIPDTVTTIEFSAFKSCLRLGSIVIPDSVTIIDDDAFANCITLKDVTLSKGLTELGYRAFENTAIESIEIPRSLDKADTFTGNNYTFNDKKYYVPDGPFSLCENLKTVTFQKGTNQIAEYLFAGAIGIEEITIPDTVTTIEYGAFKSCLRLGSIVIPDSVTTIDDDAFAYCTTLKDVTLSKGLTKLGSRAFEKTAIESVEIPKSLDKADTFSGNNYTFNDKEYYVPDGPFSLCENLKTVTFEEGTTQIAEYLFAGAVGLEEITIPDTVTVIEESAFEGCVRLTDITIPQSVTTIQRSAFSTCASMTSIVLPDSVNVLQGYAFEYCTALTDISLPDTLTVINFYTFRGCTALVSITLPESIVEISNNAFQNCSALKEFAVPENVKELGSQVFEGCTSLEKVSIPQSTKKIGSATFAGCEYLTIVEIADYSIKELASGMFKDCFELAKIQLPKGLETIKGKAFVNCTSLYDVIIPESVTSIDDSAFSYPAKTTIYSQTDSYVEQFARDGGFKFEDNVIEALTITPANADAVVYLKAGEEFRLKFNYGPEDANEVIKLTADNNNVTLDGHDMKARYRGTTSIIAETGNGATYTLTVNVRTVDKIEIAAKPTKTVYNLGEELDLKGIVVNSLYNDEYTEEITDFTVTGFDSSRTGKTVVEIGWSDLTGKKYTESFELEIVDPSAFEMGDVDLNGKLNIKDATTIQKYLASLLDFTDEQKRLADFNADTKLNVKDVTTIQKELAGLL